MYESIHVPVDNSELSNRCLDLAVQMGTVLGSTITGSHVYAAQMHDYRFKQMEYTLPEEYLQEKELERQRKIHDSLITMGLELISDSYLDVAEKACKDNNIPFVRKMMDGKHTVELIKDIETSGYDLTIMGAHGLGKTRDAQLGSVASQVTRHVSRDVWLLKEHRRKDYDARDTILVALDGSPRSFGALRQGMRLARMFDKKLDLIAVYDPYLHYSVFSGIVNILSEKAKKVFRFEEQNQLHEEIIDTGLASIYQSHLNVGEAIAREEGFEPTKTLLDGKAFQKILDHVRKTEPWLLIMGRTGAHAEDGERGLGNTTDNLLRMVPCDVYLNAHAEVPKLDLKAEEAIRWTDEANERMARVPTMVRGIARTAILRMAIEQGHSVITDSLILEAMDRFMPKFTNDRTTRKVAEAIAFERASEQRISLCKHCGVTAKEADPIKCTVCGKSDFETISPELIAKIANEEGGLKEEASFDGRKLKWSKEARLELRGIDDAYQRRRAKARIEKTARIKRLDTITLEHVRTIIEEELGSLPINLEKERAVVAEQAKAEPEEPTLPLIATDERGNAMHSTLAWEQPAIDRMMRVPAGFMRERTQGRSEEEARKAGAATVTLAHVEAGLEAGRKMMEALLGSAEGVDAILEQLPQEKKVDVPEGSTGKCPFHAALEESKEEKPAINEAVAVVSVQQS